MNLLLWIATWFRTGSSPAPSTDVTYLLANVRDRSATFAVRDRSAALAVRDRAILLSVRDRSSSLTVRNRAP